MIDSTRWVAALTLTLTVVFAGSAWATGGLDDTARPRELLLIAANTLPLLAVRWNPVAVVLTFAVAYPLWASYGHPTHILQSLPTLAAMYAAGAWDRPLWLRAIALASPVWMVSATVTGWWDADPLELGYVGVVFVVVWVLGVVLSGRRRYALELEARTAQLEEARRELAENAVANERARIARELHDVIAHAMSVITVQAGVGAHLVDSHPGQAGQALAVIERTGREAMSEMRRMLAVLRDPDPHAPRPGPQPGLADLPQLVAQVGEAGVPVELATEGPQRLLPAGLDLAVYRVVQEALTNVVKHAAGGRAFVTVRQLPEQIEVEVRNSGSRRDDTFTPGQGLRGMTERVALYQGALEAVADDGGFRVTARFPVGTDS